MDNIWDQCNKLQTDQGSYETQRGLNQEVGSITIEKCA